MPISIGSNIASLKAQRQLGRASDALSNIYERLSSGQRINRASDTAELARQSILQQSGAAVLAHANLSPNLALTLLR